MKNDLDHIITGCLKNDPGAQKELYELYSPVLYAICLRYMKRSDRAEDVLIESFYKIFTKINTYKQDGSFEGWMKRIVVNEALMELRKNNALNLSVELNPVHEKAVDENIISKLGYEEILSLVDQLPDGYRTVFNLYVIEGYKHREIADILGISINTSKSQLILAKKRLQEYIEKKTYRLRNIL